MSKDIEIEVLKNNVMQLQKQLHDAQIRIAELNEELNKGKRAQEFLAEQTRKGLGL